MKRPGTEPDSFTLNNTVDLLWKREFDQYRKRQIPHPIMIKNQIDAIPFMHESINQWRSYKAGGIRFINNDGIELYGVIDDICITPKNELIIVDFKATAKHKQFMTYNARNQWKDSNKRQMAFYANLFKQNGFSIHNTGYFIYSTARKDMPHFNQKLDFESALLPCDIDDSWIDPTVQEILYCLDQSMPPEANKECLFCKF